MSGPPLPLKRRPNGEFSLPQSDSFKARIFLAIACVWPIVLLALFASSAPRVDQNSPPNSVSNVMNIKNVLDRVDIMGYGPTHPRVGVVIVGNEKENLVRTLESVFQYTDMNRIFVVVVVVDGHEEDMGLIKDLYKIDSGAIPHWHGQRPDLHNGQKEDDEDPHGRKVHVIFNKKKLGMAESRADGVAFIDILRKQHEAAGLKAVEEDLILLLLQSGAQLTSIKWLTPVTESLIVPPPILGKGDASVSMKIANAVSFNLEGPGKRTSFDLTLTPVVSEPTADEINESNGASYPTPAFNGAAMAMRLDTYLNLPSQDMSLTEAWPADLDLALNLWLCGDGIDSIRDLEVTSIQPYRPAPLAPEMAARFAAAWMDDILTKKFFNAYTAVYKEVTYLEWEKLMSKAQGAPSFTKDLVKKCRSFAWYAEEVNPDLRGLLMQSAEIAIKEPKEEEKEESEEQDDDEGGDNEEEPEKKGGDAEDLSIPQRMDLKKPSKPLCGECLEIVQKAKFVDISYVDVTGGFKEHPHMGATYPNGTFGYVADETALRNNPPKLVYSDEDLRAACLKRDNNYRMLHEKVSVDMEAHEAAEKSGKKRDKIFCLVYTIDSGHPKLANIRQTWGPKCDGFLVGSNLTDPAVGAANIVHDGEEDYHNIWQKVRSMWSYVYDNYYEKYDWFHIGGDDLFLIIENLRLYLESDEIRTAANGGVFLPDGTEKKQTPLFMGRRFAYQGDLEDVFNSGGSGYTLNKAALKTLVVEGFPKYWPHMHTFSEDVMVARIFQKFGVFPYETKDEAGGERYMPFMPGHHWGYRMPKNKDEDWYAKYSINVKEGADHCAAKSVAFHYVKGDAMKRLYALLYKLCPADTMEK